MPSSPGPPPGGVPGRRGTTPAASATQALHDDSAGWVRWRAQQLDMPMWWWEFSAVPGQSDVEGFVMQVHVSFQLPKASSCTQGVDNDYLGAAKSCLDHDRFLPISNMRFGGQDY